MGKRLKQPEAEAKYRHIPQDDIPLTNRNQKTPKFRVTKVDSNKFRVYICDMKSKEPSRSYQMVARAEAMEETTRRIQRATVDLWREMPYPEITLEKVAERAGVSSRTVLRRFGSRDQLFESCINNDEVDIRTNRMKVPTGDVEEVIRVLMEDYELNGDANIRTLAAESEFDLFGKMLRGAREFHRNWLARVFEPYLPGPDHPDYDRKLDAFYAATEVYLWKVLRRDLGRSAEEVREVFRRLIYSLIEND